MSPEQSSPGCSKDTAVRQPASSQSVLKHQLSCRLYLFVLDLKIQVSAVLGLFHLDPGRTTAVIGTMEPG